MHCNSKHLVDEKIDVLERNLLKHCQLIDELATNLESLKLLPTKNSKQTKLKNIVECHVEQAKGEQLLYLFIYSEFILN